MGHRPQVEPLPRRIARAIAVGALCTAFLIPGCASRPRKLALETDPATLDDMGFQAYLPDIPVLTVDEACRAILILADGQDKTDNWQQRYDALLERGMVRANWRLQAGHLADRGTIAFMVCKACRIQGGVNARLLGGLGIGDRRYAHRELAFMRLLPPGTEWQTMTGAQMVSLMGKADEMMEEKGLYETKTLDIGQERDLGVDRDIASP